MINKKNRHCLTTTAAAFLSLALLAGCASTPNEADANSATQPTQAELQAQQQAQAEARAQQAKAEREQAAAEKSANNNANAFNDDAKHPTNATPGQCYARVMIPAQYETVTDQIQVSPESLKYSVQPAKYEWVEERIKTKDASEKVVVVPATYKTKTLKVVDVPEHTEWQRGKALQSKAIQTRMNSNGDLMCLVTVPATYKTVTKKVVDTPAHTKTTKIPAEYKTIRVRKLVSEAQTHEEKIPAKSQTITSQKLVKSQAMSWRRVVCEYNVDADLIRELQQKLADMDQHYYTGPIDGIYGPLTTHAVDDYAKDNGLPSDPRVVTYDVLGALNIAKP